MKIVKLCAIILIVSMSCQTEESVLKTSIAKSEAFNNWMKADLATIINDGEMNYPIANEKLLRLSNIKGATQIQFIPGVVKGELIIIVAAVNESTGKVLGQERVKQDKNSLILLEILKRKHTYVDAKYVLDKEVQKHILSYNELFDYLMNWKSKTMSNLKDYTSFNGERLHYISYSPKVINHIANLNSGLTNISWGLNKDLKMTTVFTPVITNGNERFLGFDLGSLCQPRFGGLNVEIVNLCIPFSS